MVDHSAHQVVEGYARPPPQDLMGLGSVALQLIDLRWPEGMGKREFYDLVEEAIGPGGLGVYPWGVHVDTGKDRGPRRRWGIKPT